METDDLLATALKSSLRVLPGPVTLVTTRDPETGGSAGMAASAVIPVSMAPPSMLISVNRNGQTHQVIADAGRFCINLVSTDQMSLVSLFSDSSLRKQRFETDAWQDHESIPYLREACANIFCEIEKSLIYGTHELFIGRVTSVRTDEGAETMAWVQGGFARVTSMEH